MAIPLDSAKAERATMYAKWLRDDANGLVHNIDGVGLSADAQFAVLVTAKEQLSKAINEINSAIATNRLNKGSIA